MDTTKIRMGEVIAGASAILLFLVMFLHWYGGKSVTVFGRTVSGGGASAWQIYSYTDLLLFLLIILTLGMVLLSVTQRSVALPLSLNVIVTAFGGLMTLIVLYRVAINQPGPNDFVTAKFWGYVGILLTAGIAVGAFLAMREEGTSFGDAAQRVQGATGGGAAPPPPAAPPPVQPQQPPAAQPPPAQPTPPPAEPQAPPAGQPPGEQPPPAAPPPSQPPPSQPPPGGGGPATG
jgi:hypothetical protein